MASKNPIIVYITHPIAHDTQESESSIRELTTQRIWLFLSGLNLPNHFELSNDDAFGKSVDDVVTLHKRWAENNAIDPQGINKLIFIMADEGMSPDSHPQSVLIVKILEEGRRGAGGERHQAVRVLASNAATVIGTIEGGRHGWDDFWQVAQANGGHFPGQ